MDQRIIAPIHVPFAGRENPIPELLLILAFEPRGPEQSVSHQVTILRCDGTSAAEVPKAIRLLCSCAGQLGLKSFAARAATFFCGSMRVARFLPSGPCETPTRLLMTKS